MKKLFSLIAFFVIIGLVGVCFGANSSMTVSKDTMISSSELSRVNVRVITIIFTADDGTGVIPDLTLNVSTAGILHDTVGWTAYKLEIDGNHGGTEPQENSEVYIYQNAIDLLDGNGVDKLDNTTENAVYFQTDSLPMPQPITGDLTVTVTQQAAAVASATGTLYLTLVAK